VLYFIKMNEDNLRRLLDNLVEDDQLIASAQ